MKNLMKLDRFKTLSKLEQKKIKGGDQDDCICFGITACFNGYSTCYETYEDAIGHLSNDCPGGGAAQHWHGCR